MQLSSTTSPNAHPWVVYNTQVVRPRIEDDVICRMISVDQLSYKAIMAAAGVRMANILRTDLRDRMAARKKVRAEWSEVEALYSRQRIWRKVASTAARGMRDHTSDFNRTVLESVPASWVIRVDGRPTVQDHVAEEEDKEGQEDAVCMCCFDGSSLEGNRIMFCDGCNAAVHQACYGVSEIPEGDFFCDRCRAIQVMSDNNEGGEEDAFDPDKVRDVIKCCLCPLYHGGFKPTTDGRWIHLCCALWSQKSTILDITEMSPIDVSEVEVQVYKDPELEPAVELEPDSENTPVEVPAVKPPPEGPQEPCMFCRAFGGYVVRCGGSCTKSFGSGGCTEGEEGTPCGAVFHPLCAWFQGMYLETRITDPTFQGHNRGGLYPSGLTYSFLCDDHCPAESRGQGLDQQIALRKKYQINVDDLDQIPGKCRTKRKKKRPVPVPREVS